MVSSDVKYPWPSTVNVANFVTVKPWLKDEGRTNYNIWKEQMLCLVESQGVLGFINGEILEPLPPEKANNVPEENSKISENVKYEQKLWRRTDRLVKGWILGSIGNDALGAVWELETAREVWLELEKIFNHEADADEFQYLDFGAFLEENSKSEHQSERNTHAHEEYGPEAQLQSSPPAEDGGSELFMFAVLQFLFISLLSVISWNLSEFLAN